MNAVAYPRLGIVGIGEAGCAFAAGLHDEGVSVSGFDSRLAEPQLVAGAEAAGVRLVASLDDLVSQCDVLICLTSARSAVPVAEAAAGALRAGQLYADFNSASPDVKRAAAAAIEHSGASFVDGAVMAAVPPHRHRVPVLLSGGGAERLRDAYAACGTRMEVLGPEPGTASAVKMLRSLLVKGLEALLLECAVGAQHYGVTARVLDSMAGSLPMHDWHALARYLMSRSVRHARRRAGELDEVGRTLAAAGVEPMLARAGARRLGWLADLGLAERFAAAGDGDYTEILAAIGHYNARPEPAAGSR